MKEKAALSGRRALVTGASQGLGKEIARALLAASADVAICARTAADIEAAAAELAKEFPQRRIVTATCDLGKNDEVERFYAAAKDAFGGLDIVVNNAGYFPNRSIDELDKEFKEVGFSKVSIHFDKNKIFPTILAQK